MYGVINQLERVKFARSAVFKGIFSQDRRLKRGNFPAEIMLVCIQQGCSRLPTSFSDSSMTGRSPDLSPVEHVWDQIKRQMSSCPLCT
ncbi:hypothetical protein TNCV_2250041 [Trichonephila clavipes]|nr:hypothetical protein TNCV_2250041 [Trichonephila clavipes]